MARVFSRKDAVVLNNIVNLMGSIFQTQQVKTVAPVKKSYQSNPFATTNPFISNNNDSPANTYGKNQPVFGGYFAGYHNGKPNIVGKRLFLEV